MASSFSLSSVRPGKSVFAAAQAGNDRIRRSWMAGLLLVLFLALLAVPAEAGAYNVGFRTLGYTDSSRSLRLDINVWYPTKRASKILHFPPWAVEGAFQAAPLPGPFPLIVLSHHSIGTRFSFHDTAYALASEGFVVAAPTHAMDNGGNMPNLYSWTQLDDRRREILGTVEVVLAEEDLSRITDSGRMGLLGYGAGAATALLLGGALPSCNELQAYCNHNTADTYCNRWSLDRLNAKLCSSLPLKNSPADPRFRAIAAVSPDFSMLFTREGLRYFYPPLLLAIPEKDQMNNPGAQEALAERFPRKPEIVHIDDADQNALMAPCPENGDLTLPEICRSVTRETRKSIHAGLAGELVRFFAKTLLAETPPVIPAPPDLSPKPSIQERRQTPRSQQTRARRQREMPRPRNIAPLVPQ